MYTLPVLRIGVAVTAAIVLFLVVQSALHAFSATASVLAGT